MRDTDPTTTCPMCGANLGFSRHRCLSCGETLVESQEEGGSYESYLRQRSRRSARITGFFIALLGIVCLIPGVFGLIESLNDPEHDMLYFMVGTVVYGANWCAGGVLLFRMNLYGYWLVQPLNVVLLLLQLYNIDKPNLALIVLSLIFLWLCQRCRKMLLELKAAEK